MTVVVFCYVRALNCTVETSRMIEEDRSKAQPGMIRKTIEKEMRTQQSGTTCVRGLRDQLYPVKIDNANRAAVLDQDGSIRPMRRRCSAQRTRYGIAKMIWLSTKQGATQNISTQRGQPARFLFQLQRASPCDGTARVRTHFSSRR